MTTEPQTREGKRLKNWYVGGELDFMPGIFDEMAAVVLGHPDRELLPIEEELEQRMVEALKQEIGAMMTAPEEEWVKAARSVITRLGLSPVIYPMGGAPMTFVMAGRGQ